MNGDRKIRRVPTELAALAAGVTEATIRKWASRGKITRHGSPRRAEYDLAELTALVAARATSTDRSGSAGRPGRGEPEESAANPDRT
ncbi:hypothetical protein AB0C13_03160 [Streptomyces sp. NPDC049099]|uniref:hypothetical protein n=1 Tax=Streptomyces sp. NPDC049099 TaxID=3155768 RepID=UPI00343FEA2B